MTKWNFSSYDELNETSQSAREHSQVLHNRISSMMTKVKTDRRIRRNSVLSDADKARLKFFKWRLTKKAQLQQQEPVHHE